MTELEYIGDFIIPNRTHYVTFQEHICRYAFASKFVRNKVVLDLACGSGYGSNYSLKKNAKEVVGGDVSKHALEHARKHYREHGLNFVRLDATSLPFLHDSFDVIISLETIEHIKEYRMFLSECRRVLREKGVLICSTPNKEMYSPFTEKPLHPFHVHEFYIMELYELLKEYFMDIMFFGQHFLTLKAKITSMLFSMGATLLSVTAKLSKIRKLFNFFSHSLYGIAQIRE